MNRSKQVNGIPSISMLLLCDDMDENKRKKVDGISLALSLVESWFARQAISSMVDHALILSLLCLSYESSTCSSLFDLKM